MAGWWNWETEDDRNKRWSDDFGKLAETIKQKADAELFTRQAGGILNSMYSAAERSIGWLDENVVNPPDEFKSPSRRAFESVGTGIRNLTGAPDVEQAEEERSRAFQERLGSGMTTAQAMGESLNDLGSMSTSEAANYQLDAPQSRAASAVTRVVAPAVKEGIETFSPRVRDALDSIGLGRTAESARMGTPDVGNTPGSVAERGSAVSPGSVEPSAMDVPTSPSWRLIGKNDDAYDYGSTQFNLPEQISAKIQAIGRRIPDADLAKDGREAESHITLKYGLHTDKPDEVARILANEPPIRVQLGKTSLFSAADNGKPTEPGAHDVVKIDVSGDDLHRLNQKISGALETTDTFPEYKPHVTVAYVKPGIGQRYVGDASLAGQEVVLDQVVFSSKNGERFEIPLGGIRQEFPSWRDSSTAGEMLPVPDVGPQASDDPVAKALRAIGMDAPKMGAQADDVGRRMAAGGEAAMYDPSVIRKQRLPDSVEPIESQLTLLRGTGRANAGARSGIPAANEFGVVFGTVDEDVAMSYADRGGDFGGVLPFNLRSGSTVANVSDPEVGIRLLAEYRRRAAPDGAYWQRGPKWGTQQFSKDELTDEFIKEVAEQWARGEVDQLDFLDDLGMVQAVRRLGWDAITDGDTVVIVNRKSLERFGGTSGGTPGGLVESSASPVTAQSLARAASRGAAQGAVAGGYQASQEEDADVGDVARGALQGAALGAANRSFASAVPGLRNAETRAAMRAVSETPGERRQSAADVIAAGARPITASVDDEIKRLRLDKEPPELQDIIRESLESSDFAKDMRRGVIPDDVAQEAADHIAMSIDDWIKGAKRGKPYNEEQIIAVRNAGAAQARKVSDLAKEINDAAAQGQVTDLLKVRMAVEGKRLNDFLTTVKEPARAEAGRGLRAWRFDAREFENDPAAAIERIYKRLGGKENVDEAVTEFTKLTESGADPITMANFWARVEKPPPGFTDWFKALRYNSMLSGPRTFEINALGSLVELPWKLGRDIVVSTAKGRPEEVAPEIAGMWAGAQKGAAAFMETFRYGITEEQALRGDVPRSLESRLSDPTAKKIASALELPGRINAATDEWFRAVGYSMQLGREAALQASREGVTGPAWSRRVAELLETPTEHMEKRALRSADRLTFKGDMGQSGQMLEATVSKGGIIGHLLLPFLRTSYHLTARGIERTPIGLAGLGVDVVRGKYKPDAPETKGLATIQERLGEGLPGSLATLWLMGQAASGNISAAGPDDPQKVQMLRAQGWQPYSIKIGDTWVSYANWGAFAMPFSLAASTMEGQTYKDADAPVGDVISDTFRRLAETMTEQTYLRGIGTIIQAMRDPQTYGGRWFTDTLTSLIPFGAALNTVGQATDDVLRRPDRGDIGQTVKARLPGLREEVPVATDVVGRPIPNQQTGILALNPLRMSKQSEDAMLKEFSRIGMDFGTVSPEIAGQRLTGADARTYREKAQLYRGQLASQLIETQAYKNASDEDKTRMLRNAMTRGAAWASQEVMPGANTAGREFVTVANKDVNTAIQGYLTAVEAQRKIDDLKTTRYMGYSGDDADEIAQDRSYLSRFRDQFGEAQGDSVFLARYGYRRYARAKSARVSPMYRMKVEQIERSTPELYLYLRQNPTVTELVA